MLSDYNRSKNFLFGSTEIICKGLNIILKLKNALEQNSLDTEFFPRGLVSSEFSVNGEIFVQYFVVCRCCW